MVKKTAIIKSKGGGGKILIIVESPGKITKLQEEVVKLKSTIEQKKHEIEKINKEIGRAHV